MQTVQYRGQRLCCNKLEIKHPKGMRLKQNREVIFPMGVPFVQVLFYEGSGLALNWEMRWNIRRRKKITLYLKE
jgi:hypothetical protein